MKYSDILAANALLQPPPNVTPYDLAVIANVVVTPFKEILEYTLRVAGIPAIVRCGNYDTVAQDCMAMRDAAAVIIIWELANITEGLPYQAALMSQRQQAAVIAKGRREIACALAALRRTPTVIIGRFSTLAYTGNNLTPGAYDHIKDSLNGVLDRCRRPNMTLFNTDQVLSFAGVANCIDWRFFYEAKTPYSQAYYRALAGHLRPLLLSASGRQKKALIVDCDGTLWKGIVGEDGMTGIGLSPQTAEGTIFREAQAIIRALGQAGVIIGLVSKNNSADVDEVFRTHDGMILRERDITIRRIGWQAKADSVREIAAELNIGLDSMVFIDDSSFEIAAMNKINPAVLALQVPERLADYPAMMREVATLFPAGARTAEDKAKTALYRTEKRRQESRASRVDLTDYLTSLKLKIAVARQATGAEERLAQLTQKTNQFNLTTRRYTTGQMRVMLRQRSTRVYAFSARDRFGDYGITGLCIVRVVRGTVAVVDTFLMSCRVIGRQLEYAFMDWIINDLQKHRVRTVRAAYFRTEKNIQVSAFYDGLGFTPTARTAATAEYVIDLRHYVPHCPAYIRCAHD